MKKDALVFLEHILDSSSKIEEFIENMSKNDFLEDIKSQDAIVRRLEIIGEATKNIPIEFTNKYKEIAWKDIAKLRDKLIHHYFGVDLDTVWGIINKDIPELKEKIEKLLKMLKK